MTLNSYAPLGTPDHMIFFPTHMPVLLPDNAVVRAVAARVGRSPAAVLQRWAIQRGFVVNARTEKSAVRIELPLVCSAFLFTLLTFFDSVLTPQHMQDNLGATSFVLADSDVAQLNGIDTPPSNVCGDPHLIP